MNLSTYGLWLEEYQNELRRIKERYPQYVQNEVDRQKLLDEKRNERAIELPYSVIAEGHYWEQDFAQRWCWHNIGPMNGRCDWRSEYPGCPLVLATEYIKTHITKGDDGAERRKYTKAYNDPGEHEHEGDWTYQWFGKTDYDFGFGEYRFAHATDRSRFLRAFHTFTWNESWDEYSTTKKAS